MITVSWSVINSYDICPMKIEHEMNGVEHSISWPLAWGSIGHSGLAAWAQGKDWREVIEAEYRLYTSRKASQKDWNGEFSDNTGVIERAMVIDLLTKYTNDMDRVPNPKMVEQNLTRDLGDGVWLTGKVDWLEMPIVDWKFTRNISYLSPIQALCYAILSGGPCEFEYHALVKARNPYWDIVPVKETEKQENLDRVVEFKIKPVAKAIEAKVFPANPSHRLCSSQYCGYWNMCPGRFV